MMASTLRTWPPSVFDQQDPVDNMQYLILKGYPGEKFYYYYHYYNHNYNKIVKSDWQSTALISALIGQFNRTVRVMHK